MPFLALARLCRMSCSGSCSGVSGVKLRMSLPSGWRGCCGLAMGLVSSRKVSSLPGASGAARSACRARESSPRRVSWVARLALWSGVGWLEAGGGGCARWLGAVLAARRSCQAPSKNLVKRSSNCGFGTRAVLAGRWSSIRGRNNQSFQALSWSRLLLMGAELMRSSVKCKARRNGPRRNGGGARKVGQGCSKKSLAWRRSRLANAS